MKLIDNWRKSYRMFSMQAMVASTAVLGAWLAIPDDLKGGLPHWVPNVAGVVLLVAGIIGRLVKQGPKDGSD